MPLVTPSLSEAQRKALEAQGLNPDEYELPAINTDEFEPLDNAPAPKLFDIAPQMSPFPQIDSLSRVNKVSMEPTVDIDPTAPSEIGSFSRQAAANVLPSTVGFGAGAIGAAVGAPFFPPIGPIVGSLVAGLPAYIGAKKLQDKLTPQAWLDTLKKDVEVNPTSSLLGNIVGQAPTMRVSPTSIRDVIKGVPNLARSKATQAEVKAVGNAILGAGIGGTGAGVQSLPGYVAGDRTGWDLTKDIAMGSVLGALQNKQTKLGEAIARGGSKIVDAAKFKFSRPLEPEIVEASGQKQLEAPIVTRKNFDESLPVVDAEVTPVAKQLKEQTFHTPETEVAMAEAQAKIKKTQEDTIKIQEETTRVVEETKVAEAQKTQAAAELVKASQGNVEVAPPAAEPTPSVSPVPVTTSEVVEAPSPAAIAETPKPKATPTEPSRPFITTTEREILDESNPLKLTKFKSGDIDARTVGPRLRNRLHPDEWKMLEEAGIQEFLAKGIAVKPDELQKFVEANSLKLDTHTYGMEHKVSALQKEFDDIRHWLDTNKIDGLNYPRRIASRHAFLNRVATARARYYPDLTDEQLAKVERLDKLDGERLKLENLDLGPRATSVYNRVSMFDTEDGKNVQRIDVTLPSKYDSNKQYDKPVLWREDNLHENLPNTIGWSMVQKTTGPNDEKIAAIAELQSRWGQEVRNVKQLNKETGGIERDWSSNKAGVSDHPSLKHYESLILKATIRQAKLDGDTHVFIPDGNTAMITEGHDMGLNNPVSDIDDISAGPRQAKGMRLHYDVTLPSIMKKLLGGQEGERISLGEHKNTYETKEQLERWQPALNEQELAETKLVRKDLFFKNPDGTPKTDITGKLYDIRDVDISKPFDTFSQSSLVPSTKAQAPKKIAKVPKETIKYPSPALVAKPGAVDTIPVEGSSAEDNSIIPLPPLETRDLGRRVDLGAGANRGLPPANNPPSNNPPNGSLPPQPIPPVDDPYYPPKDPSRQSWFPSWASSFDQVRPLNNVVAEAFHNAKTDGDKLIGRFVNKPIDDLMKLNPTEQEMEHVMKAMNEAYRDSVNRGIPPKIDLGLSEKEEAIRAVVTAMYQDVPTEAKARGMSINGRFTIDNPNVNYISAKPDPEVLYIINKNPDGVEARSFARIQANYLVVNHPDVFSDTPSGYEKARAFWTDYVVATQGDKSYASVDFGPLHKMQGYGLAPEIQDWNLPRVMSQYGNRAAGDMAFHTNMKTVPDVAGPLKLRHRGSGKLVNEDVRHTDISRTDEVIGAFKHLSNDFNYGNPTIAAATRVVTSHMIGFMTGVGDIVSTPTHMAPYMDRADDIVSSFKGLANLTDAYKRSLAVNARQRKIDVRLWGNMESPGQPVVEAMQKWADIVRLAQVREATDQLSKVLPFAVGRQMAKVRIMDYVKTGNKDSRDWLEMFGRGVVIGELDPASGFINDQLDQIAKNFTDRVSGSYGGDQLPVAVMDGQYAPFMTLAKWSIAKANVSFQDTIKPAYRDQNYGPLLRMLLAGFGSAALFRTLQELLTHKKSNEATLAEVMEKGNKLDMVAYMANAMQVSGVFGIMMMPVKAASDMLIKGEQEPRFSLNNPLLQFMSENVIKNFVDAREAIAEGEDLLTTIGNAAMLMLKNMTQNLRMLHNQTLGREDVERSNKIRDLKVFNALGDAKDNPERTNVRRQIGLASNPLLDRDEKAFKRATDLDKAREMIPELLKKIDAEAQGNEEKRFKLIKGLMKDTYPTFPSIHTSQESADQAVEYTKYLINVYGKEEALKRFNDYVKHGELQRDKSEALMMDSMK